MRILYVAKHDCGDNDDEGAIAHALEQLGHEVIKVHEKLRHRPLNLCNVHKMNSLKPDLCLFHKWPNVDEIAGIDCRKVLWYFDLVQSIDPQLVARSTTRVMWFEQVIKHVDLAFCTDGDWVARNNTLRTMSDVPKYRWLMQGADERKVGRGTPYKPQDKRFPVAPIIFTGMINHGTERVRQIEFLKARYKDKFAVIGDSGPRFRIHGRDLADLLASTKVVVAPSGPCTDQYWSNRIFLSLGFGAVLAHPRCRNLDKFYTAGVDYLDYTGDHSLERAIDWALDASESDLDLLRDYGLKATKYNNLYRHRLIEMLEQVEEIST